MFCLVAAMIFLLWVLFSGRITWEIAGFGVVIALGLAWFVQRFVAPDLTLRRQWLVLKRIPSYLKYAWLLVQEIVLANFQVMKLIWSDREIVVPKLAVFQTRLSTTSARVVLADCITLTPGTITVHLEDDHYLVHCLDESMEAGLHDSSFERRLEKMEKSWIKEAKL